MKMDSSCVQSWESMFVHFVRPRGTRRIPRSTVQRSQLLRQMIFKPWYRHSLVKMVTAGIGTTAKDRYGSKGLSFWKIQNRILIYIFYEFLSVCNWVSYRSFIFLLNNYGKFRYYKRVDRLCAMTSWICILNYAFRNSCIFLLFLQVSNVVRSSK